MRNPPTPATRTLGTRRQPHHLPSSSSSVLSSIYAPAPTIHLIPSTPTPSHSTFTLPMQLPSSSYTSPSPYLPPTSPLPPLPNSFLLSIDESLVEPVNTDNFVNSSTALSDDKVLGTIGILKEIGTMLEIMQFQIRGRGVGGEGEDADEERTRKEKRAGVGRKVKRGEKVDWKTELEFVNQACDRLQEIIGEGTGGMQR